MKRHTVPQTLLVLLALLPAMLACNFLSRAISPAQATQPAARQATQALPATAASAGSGPVRQWAAEAQASSEYGSSDWAAYQATGEPNTPECGDIGTAWAASSQDTKEWINLYFKLPVFPTEIRFVETYYPDQVVQVDLIDMQGQYVPVYTSRPTVVEGPCPFILTVPVKQGSPLAQGVRITIDQSALKNWNEIDAVEIAGMPGEGAPVRPVIPAP